LKARRETREEKQPKKEERQAQKNDCKLQRFGSSRLEIIFQ
jgi:hypothetical protein